MNQMHILTFPNKHPFGSLVVFALSQALLRKQGHLDLKARLGSWKLQRREEAIELEVMDQKAEEHGSSASNEDRNSGATQAPGTGSPTYTLWMQGCDAPI